MAKSLMIVDDSATMRKIIMRTVRMSGLEFELIATDVKRTEMAIDMRHDGSNKDRYPLLYEKDELRLFRVDPIEESRFGETPGLAPLLTESLKVIYRETKPIDIERMAQKMDLNSLIGMVNQDSLFSYSTQLETYRWRVTATSGNYLSRNWIIDKLDEFGYDSIIIDSFEMLPNKVLVLQIYQKNMPNESTTFQGLSTPI